MSKKYYWIKLRTDFFDLETIDWLISQKNGCEYVVLYQKLCLLTANKGGELSSSVGEILVPYDANKIARDTKFSFDTVVVALELFKKIGLIYEQENGILKIPYVADIVGSETDSAQRVRNHRARKALQCNSDVTDTALHCNTDIDKDIEKEIEKEKDLEKEKENNVSDKSDRASSKHPEEYEKIISYLNQKADTNYKSSTKETQRLINARLAEGYKTDDFFTVIDKKCAEWLNTDMAKFLRPATLFGNKFEGYLNQKTTSQKTANNDGFDVDKYACVINNFD